MLTSEITDKEIVTVYKIASKKDNKYYSPATGIEYKIGKVEVPIIQKRLCKVFANNILNTNSHIYNTKMVGRTAGFKYLEDAKEKKLFWEQLVSIYNNTQYVLVILEIQLSQELMYGYYGNKIVYAGKKIVSMKEI